VITKNHPNSLPNRGENAAPPIPHMYPTVMTFFLCPRGSTFQFTPYSRKRAPPVYAPCLHRHPSTEVLVAAGGGAHCWWRCLVTGGGPDLDLRMRAAHGARPGNSSARSKRRGEAAAQR